MSTLTASLPLWAWPFETSVVYLLAEQLREPWLIVRFPAAAKGTAAYAWSGRLRGAAARSLLDSPVRRELTRRLMGGESAVWVLLDSGNKTADDTAYALLEKQLQSLEKSLELPKLTKAPRDKLLFEDGPKLRIAFSILRVSRDDPEESVLVQMLLGTEDDLRGRKQPIAFPIFGRGLALYALVGKGITANNVATAAEFVVGACKCEAKNQNPGVDLLLTEDWEGGLSGRLTRAPLLGLQETLPPPASAAASTPVSLSWWARHKRLIEGVLVAVIGGAVLLTVIGVFFRGKSHVRS